MCSPLAFGLIAALCKLNLVALCGAVEKLAKPPVGSYPSVQSCRILRVLHSGFFGDTSNGED
jgi:hypothetical protein